MNPNSQEEEGELPRSIRLVVLSLIVYSIVTSALETMPELSAYSEFFLWSELACVLIFTIEYLARWRLSPNPRSYPFSFMAMVDLLAILPFYLRLGVDFRSLRSLRLLRVFRIFKLGRHSRALQSLGDAFRRTRSELAVTAFIAVIVILISATALYYAEHETQPEVYRSIPDTIWWAVVTLTTVGYGDVYPVTFLGRIVAGFVMLAGIGFIAIPCGLLSGAFSDILKEQRESEAKKESDDACPTCGGPARR
ncbi:MAG: ion transporter [Planctomycetales bacterium]